MVFGRAIRSIAKGAIAFNLLAMAAGLIARWLVPPEGDGHTDEFVHPTIMFGTEFRSEATGLRYGRVFTLMGGTKVDLSAAQLAPGARLDVTTIMGGVELQLAPGWRVEAHNVVMAGGAEMTLDGQDDLPPDAPVVQLQSQTIMGGLVVRNRPRRRSSLSPV